MEITISARKVNLKDNFKERVEKKLGKFNRIFSSSAKAKVTVTVNKNNQTVEVTIWDNGMIYRSESTCIQMNEALDNVVDSLGRQIRKHKSKLAKKLRDSDLSDLITENIDETDEDHNENEYDLVRVKHFSVVPISVQEAILQMNMLEHEFFMFKNIDTDRINVIYTRKNGTYGLLDPQE